jgi:hypothetical protein
MKTPIGFNSKENEVIAWCSLNVWSCFFLNSHHCYMCYHHQHSLHHNCANWVNNDDVHQGSEGIFGDKDIHSSLGITKKKVGNLPLDMCSTFQNNSWDCILKCIVDICSFPQGHQSKWVLKLSMIWSHSHHERWATIGCGKPRRT